MALRKSERYSSLWSSCNELRGGIDASLCFANTGAAPEPVN
jgi:hypothetical protein